MTDLYVPDDLDPGEITVCDGCGAVTDWPTGYATSERCRDCGGWKNFATLPEHVPGPPQ